MRPVSGGNSRHSLVGGAACQKTPIPWSALDKNPMAEPNSKAILWNKAQHEGAVTPRCIVQKNPQVPHTNRQVACHPMNNARVKRSSIPPHKTRPDSPVPTLQGPCGRSPKRRGSLRCLPPLEVRPSSVAPDPAESRGAPPPPQDPSPLRGTPGSSLRSPAEGEGHEGFPPPPDRDLESPSSTRLEALVPSRDSRARTRSPSPRAWRPDFPGAAREAP